MEYFTGFLIGSVLGLTGAGGSVFAVPLLIYLVLLSPQNAIGVSLGAVGISALFGTLIRLKSRQIQWLPAVSYSLIGGLFTPIGLYLNRMIEPVLLMLSFSVLVILVATRMWHQASKSPDDASIVRSIQTTGKDKKEPVCRANNNKPFKIGVPCLLAISSGAILTGILSGLFGVGGGFLIVPTLLYLIQINIRQAVATSLVVIALICLTGFASFIWSNNDLDIFMLARVSAGGIAGMCFGILISRFIAGPLLQKIFSILMLCMAGITVFMSIAT